MSERCSCECYNPVSRRFYLCRNAAKIEVDGQFYCGVHDPIRRKARQDAIDAKQLNIAKARSRNYLLSEEAKEAVRAIARGHNDPQTLCREILERAGERVDA